VFPATRGRAPLRRYSDGKKELDRQLQFKQPWTLHDLRRTARSLMSGRVTRETAERVLGHRITDATSTESVYDRHDYLAEKSQALQILADRINAILNPSPSNVVTLKRSQPN